MVTKDQSVDAPANTAVAIREADLGKPMTALAPTQYIPPREELRGMMELANFLVGAQMIPKGITRSQDVMLILLYGRQLEIDPMTACQKLFVIDGRIGMYAELMLALAKRNDPTLETDFSWSDADGGSCTCVLSRRGKIVQTTTYTVKMAEKSGQMKRAGPWHTYTRDMLAWNAGKRALRLGAPDLYLAVHPRGVAAEVDRYADNVIEGSAVVIDEADADPEPLPAPTTAAEAVKVTPPEAAVKPSQAHTAADPGESEAKPTETPAQAEKGPQHADRVTELRRILKLASERLAKEAFAELRDSLKSVYPQAMGKGPDGIVRFGPQNLSDDELEEAISDITRILAPKPEPAASSEPAVDPQDLPFE